MHIILIINNQSKENIIPNIYIILIITGNKALTCPNMSYQNIIYILYILLNFYFCRLFNEYIFQYMLYFNVTY